MQLGIPGENVSHIINPEMDVRLVSGGKLRYVFRFGVAAGIGLISNLVRRDITCLSELLEEESGMQLQSTFGTIAGYL